MRDFARLDERVTRDVTVAKEKDAIEKAAAKEARRKRKEERERKRAAEAAEAAMVAAEQATVDSLLCVIYVLSQSCDAGRSAYENQHEGACSRWK